MNKININYLTLFNSIVFTGLFFLVLYYAISYVDNIIYMVVFSLMALIIYINILRKFFLEMFSLEVTRISEFFIYFIMYVVTISVLAMPFFVEPNVVFEAPIIRYIIIGFATILLTKYTFFMLLGPWHDIKMKLRHKLYFSDVDYKPLVSVMIPAWNEGVGIINTIESILTSTYRKVEIIVVNDGSTDDSDERMRAFLARHEKDKNKDIKIRYIYQSNTGKGGALNHAISLAKGEILLSIDADCAVDKEAIAEFVKVFKDPEVCAAVGNVKIGNKNNAVGIVQYLEFLFSFYFKRVDALLGSIYIIGGAAGAFRREVFEKLGGYCESNITEDIELTVRMQDAGMKIEYANEAVVYTEGANDIASLRKQRLRWKRGRFQTFYQYWYLFFSTKKRHNKFLTWFIMPLAVIQEFQLLLEIPFIIFMYVFSFVNSDFSSYLSGILVVGLMFFIQIMFYEKSTRRLSFVLLAPIGWLLFYVATYVEVWALIKSIDSFIFKREIIWQKWERKGVGVKSV